MGNVHILSTTTDRRVGRIECNGCRFEQKNRIIQDNWRSEYNKARKYDRPIRGRPGLFGDATHNCGK